MNIVGYSLGGQDNDTFMFEEEADVATCKQCGYRLDFQATNPEYVLKRNQRDLSATYDGQDIASARFRDYCVQEGFPGVEFIGFKHDSNHFHMVVTRQVKFDAVRRKTRFDKLCPTCGNYESVTGATPCYLLEKSPLGEGFFRTDLLFASGNEKGPIILVGQETMTKLKASRLKGLEFKPAYGMD